MKIKNNLNKKITFLLMILVIALAITACGNKNNGSDSDKASAGNAISEDSTNEATEDSYVPGFDKSDENIIDDKYGTCYQVFIYSFCDSNGDGIGDINGLTSKLDYISDMGFTSIWLLPFNQSTTYHKYDVVDYYSIDSQYGTMEDFENLVAACKEKNIDIYMDLVINHTSSQNKWFLDACEYIRTLKAGEEPDYKVCPYAEYYNFERADACPSGYNKVSGTTDWYYECVFWSEMPDLNLACQGVKDSICDIADFWIDKGIMGFRMDAALHYFDSSKQQSIDTLKWFYDYVESVNPDIYVVAEVWDTYLTMQEFAASGVDSIFDYSLGNTDGIFIKKINRLGNGKAGKELAEALVSIDDTYRAINENYVDGVFLANHDTGRAAGFFAKKEDKVKLAAGVSLMTRGCVFVYYGDELGMSGSGKDENKRAPMYWTEDASDSEYKEAMTAGPPDMDKQEHKFGSYVTQKTQEFSIYNYYKKAIHLRNKYPEIGRGTYSLMDDISAQNGNVYALAREYEGKIIYVLFNISEEQTVVTLDKTKYTYKDISEYLLVNENMPSLDGDKLTIPEYGCVIIEAE